MKCLITNCNHKVRKGVNAKKPISLSWREYHICVCCARELRDMGTLDMDFHNSLTCSLAIKLEKQINKFPEKIQKEMITDNQRRFNMITIYTQQTRYLNFMKKITMRM